MSVCKAMYEPIRDALRTGSLTPELLKTLTQNEPQVCKDCIMVTCTSVESIDSDRCNSTCFS
jgi:hypothetical protein